MALEHKVDRVRGDMDLASRLDERTAQGWEIVSIMLKSAAQDPSEFIIVMRKPVG